MTKVNRSLPLSLWPEQDRSSFEQARRPPRFGQKVNPATKWAPETEATFIRHYGRWLAFLQETLPHLLDMPPGERCTGEVLDGYLERLEATTAALSVVGSIHGLARMLASMVPDHDWSWLYRIGNDLKLDARPSRDKRSKLRPSDEILVKAIKALRKLQKAPTSRATLTGYRDMLMVAILTPCPIRRKNFAGLTIGQDFIRGEDDWRIVLPNHLVKNGEPITLEVPSFLTNYVDHYLSIVRSSFAGAKKSARLWLNWFGAPMTGHSVYLRVAAATSKHIGVALNPHIFRDCAATFLSWESEAAVAAAQGLLAHRTSRSTEKYYIHAKQIESGRAINSVLQELLARGSQ